MYTKDLLGAPNSDDKGDCATESHKITTTYGHHNKIERHSRST